MKEIIKYRLKVMFSQIIAFFILIPFLVFSLFIVLIPLAILLGSEYLVIHNTENLLLQIIGFFSVIFFWVHFLIISHDVLSIIDKKLLEKEGWYYKYCNALEKYL